MKANLMAVVGVLAAAGAGQAQMYYNPGSYPSSGGYYYSTGNSYYQPSTSGYYYPSTAGNYYPSTTGYYYPSTYSSGTTYTTPGYGTTGQTYQSTDGTVLYGSDLGTTTGGFQQATYYTPYSGTTYQSYSYSPYSGYSSYSGYYPNSGGYSSYYYSPTSAYLNMSPWAANSYGYNAYGYRSNFNRGMGRVTRWLR